MGKRVKYIGPLDKFKGLLGELLELHGDGAVQVRWDNGLLEWHDGLSVYPYAAEPAEPAPFSSFVTSNDPVNQPQHYQFFPDLEAIEVIARSTTQEQFYGYALGNALKYRLRAGSKDDLEQDIAKAKKYIELYEEYKHLCHA